MLRRIQALRAKRAQKAKDCPVVYNLVVNHIQDGFLKSKAKETWAIGGNQSGKTFVCCAFLVQKTGFYTKYRVRTPIEGEKDWRKWPVTWTECPPGPDETLRIRYMAIDFNKVHEIVLPHIYDLIPPSLLDLKRGTKFPGYNVDTHILYIRDRHRPELRHEIHFATYDQDVHKIEGGKFDYVLYDEPPPKNIYKGNKVRLLAKGGRVRGALTPIEEIPWPIEWIHHDIVCKADGKRIDVFRLPTHANLANLSQETYDDLLRDMTEDQRKVRLFGEFGFLKGLVYKQFSTDLHVVPRFDVAARVRAGKGLVFVGLDHGYRNPEAASFWYVEGAWPDVRAWKFMEYLASGLTIYQNCANLLEMIGEIPVEAWLADPVSCWRMDDATGSQMAEQYWACGVPIQKADNDVAKGHNIIASLLEPLPDEYGRRSPRIFFFEGLPETITAYMSYAWQHSRTRHGEDQKEKPEEKYKHIPDTDRYVWSLPPSGVPLRAPPERPKGHFGYPIQPSVWGKAEPQTFMERELSMLGPLPEGR